LAHKRGEFLVFHRVGWFVFVVVGCGSNRLKDMRWLFQLWVDAVLLTFFGPGGSTTTMKV